MSVMRILHYLPRVRSADGGPVQSTLDLCELLAARGHEVTLLTRDPSDVPKGWRSCESGTPSVAVWSDMNGWAAIREVVRAQDVAHFHNLWTVSVYGISRLARRARVPYVFSLRGTLDDWSMAQSPARKRVYLAVLGNRLLCQAAAVHCTAEAEVAQATRWVTGPRVVVAPNVVRHRAGASGGSADTPEGTVLYLSRLHYKKGPDVLLHAFARLRTTTEWARLVLAGPGEASYVEELKALATDLGVAEMADFLGIVSGPDKERLFAAADVFVLPTSQENFGRVLFEALLAGTPVVTTRGADTWPELQRSGGAVITEREPTAIARAVEGLLRDPDRRAAMGEAGRRWAHGYLDPNSLAEAYEAIYSAAGVPSTEM